MAVPDFVLALREKIGHSSLWLVSGTAVVLRGDDILLIRRSDTGEWAPISGIIDPGEEAAVAMMREALEEANVDIEVERLSSTWVIPPVSYANGDEAQYLDLTFRCRYVGGDPKPVDDEALEVAWHPIGALPPMRHEFAERIRHALAEEGPAFFTREPLDWSS